MVLFMLCVKADLEGVASMSIKKPIHICISVKNPLSDFEKRERIVLSSAEYVEHEENNSSREPPCHFALKWEGSKKRSTIEVLDEGSAKSALKKSGKKKGEVPREITANDTDEFVPVLALECRGVEPVRKKNCVPLKCFVGMMILYVNLHDLHIFFSVAYISDSFYRDIMM